MEIVHQEGYAKGDVDFKSRSPHRRQDPDVRVHANYYQDDGLIITQARASA